MSINKETFHAFVEQILTAQMPGFAVTSNGVAYLLAYIEHYLKGIVSAAEECRKHAGHSSLRMGDIRLSLTLKKRKLPFCLKRNLGRDESAIGP